MMMVEPRLNYFLHMRADLIKDHGQHMDKGDKDILVSMKIYEQHVTDEMRVTSWT